MKRCSAVLASAALVMTLAAILSTTAARAGVDVNFIAPERYADSELRTTATRGSIVAELRRHLQSLGAHHLKPGQSLTIDILDIDLAGEYEPWRPGLSQTRVMRDTTPPRMRLRYRLTEQGRILKRGTETISNMSYLMSPSARRSGERLAHDKELLSDWFQTRFGGR